MSTQRTPSSDVAGIPNYEPDAYWERLLSSAFDASGVAYSYLALSFNQTLYRAERDVVRRSLAARPRTPPPRSALDIGCGTGIWIRFWNGLGVNHVTGVDLTESSISQLRGRNPEQEFVQADIGDPEFDLGRQFDVISAMSVLLHIVDPGRFSTAIANLARHLAPGGELLMIEPVIVNPWWGEPFGPHSNSRVRTTAEWERELASHGLEIIELKPVTFLLANPIDARSPRTLDRWERYWSYVLRFVGRRERVGAVAGAALELLDRPLRRRLGPGPSAKLVVVRHQSGG